MEFYDNRGQLIRISATAPNDAAHDATYRVTVEGARVGVLTRIGPRDWAGRSARHGDSVHGKSPQECAEQLAAIQWHYSERTVY